MDKKVKKNLSAALATTVVAGIGATAIPAQAAEVKVEETKEQDVAQLYAKAHEATMKVVQTAEANEVKAYFDKENGGPSTTEAVVKAVEAEMQKQINAARDAISELPEEMESFIGTLSEILDNYQHPVYERIVTVTNKLNAEGAKLTQAEINNVRGLLLDLPVGYDNNGNLIRESYSSALDNAQIEFTKLVIDAVKKAEKTLDREDLEAAKALVEELKTVKYNEDLAKFAAEEEEKVVAVEKAIEEEEAKLTVESVIAINETAVQVTGLDKKVKEADLKDKKITLKAGEVSLTATYVATSLTEEGKANFVLETEKKLEDAVTYTVSADWANFTTSTFMAKGLAAPHVSTVEVLTKGVPAANASADANIIHFTAKNQYGEDIALAGNVDNLNVKGTINGVPFIAAELVKDAENGSVRINKNLAEGDKVTLTFTNKVGDKTFEVGTVSYTVVKAEAAVATTVSNMKAVYANAANGHVQDAEAKEVLPEDNVTLSATVKNQFGSPMVGESVRWVVEEGKEFITKTDDTAIAEVSDAPNFSFKATKAGKVKISAYIGNGEKATYEVMVGAKALDTLNLGDEAGTRFNQDENIVKVVTANAGANLTADMIKFDVKATKTNVDVTAADVQVVAKLRGEVDKNATDDNKNDIVIVVKSLKEGKYTITPYVGESLEKATAKVAGFDVITTIDQAVTSIDNIAFDALELKTGKEIKKDVTFRNKHNEVVVLENGADGLNVVATPVIDGDGQIASVTKDDETNKNVLTLKVNTAKTYNVVIQKGDIFKSFNLTFAAPTFTKIDAGADITGVVAGDLAKQAKDQAIKFLDQDGKEMPIKAEALKVSVTKPDGQPLADARQLVQLAANYGFNEAGVDEFDEAIDAKIVKGFRVQPASELAQGVYTVKIATTDGKIADTFTVTVGAARVAKTVEVTPVSTNVALNGQTIVKIVPKDQYGEFIAVGTDKIVVNAGANFTANAVAEVQNDANAVVGYEVALTGNTKGTNDVVVNVMDKVGADAKVLSTNKVSMTVDAVANLVASVEVDKTGIKELYSTENAGTQVQLKAIAKDVNGAVVPVANADLSWTIKSVTGKVGAVDATVGTVGTLGLHTGLYEAAQNFKGTVTIEVKTANMKVGEITLNLDDAKAVAKTGTTKVVNNVENKIVDADETKEGIQIALDGDGEKDAEADGAIVLKLTAKDQYGNAIDTVNIDGDNVIVMADDASVLKVEKSDQNETITLTAKSVGTANVYVQYNGDTIKLEVSVNDKAVKAAEKKATEAMPVGVVLGATVETTKGVTAVPGTPAVVAEAGIYSVTIGTDDITIDGKTFVYNASTEASKWSNVAELVELINNDEGLKVKYAAEVDSDNVKLTQKADHESETAPVVNGTGASVATTKEGKAAVAEVPAVDEVKEVGTTTVIEGAAKDATIKVKVADGAGLDKTVDVAVKGGDTAAQVAGKIQVALADDTDVNAKYAVTVNGAYVVLTQTGAGADVNLQVTLQA
ncbi:hypothetical protein [Clostridium amazonitimonense]|uniref:hypothetical protein n=1 Tax=Clostridium amazonitimonense TaxID=1499689 RepID=UPI0005095819|nr:hypothetical protein [Clostridium amazonitimonense]